MEAGIFRGQMSVATSVVHILDYLVGIFYIKSELTGLISFLWVLVKQEAILSQTLPGALTNHFLP